MILIVISDSCHLSQEAAGSIAGGYHYLGDRDASHYSLNAPILAVCSSIAAVCGAASETEYAALHINALHAYFERVVLEALGYKQPPTRLLADNMAAVGIANDTVYAALRPSTCAITGFAIASDKESSELSGLKEGITSPITSPSCILRNAY